MNDLELLEQHIADLQRRLDHLEVQVQVLAEGDRRSREIVAQLESRREVLPLEIQQARGAAESGVLRVAELSKLLDAARADANAHRARAHQLEGEAAAVDDRIAAARQGLERANFEVVRQRDKAAADLATAVRRRGELIAAEAKAADDHLQAVLNG